MRLIVCGTLAQLFNAIVLKQSILCDCEADICLVNTSNKFEGFVERIRKENLFRNVYVMEIQPDSNQSLRHKIKKFFLNMSVVNEIGDKLPNKEIQYDCIYISGPSSLIIGVYYFFKQKNTDIRLFIYEEGVHEYYMYLWKRNKALRLYSKIIYKRFYLDDAEGVLVYDHNFALDEPSHIKKIDLPKLDRVLQTIVSPLNNIFAFDKNVLEIFDQYKVLFIEQECFIDKENRKQREILQIILDKVGKENILVKLHPASSPDKYTDMDVECKKIPYTMELIRLNSTRKDLTLISVFSSAVFNYKIIFDDEPEIILLNNLVQGSSSEMKKISKKFASAYPSGKISSPSTKEELVDRLSRLI